MQRNDVQDDEKQQLQENEDSFNQVLHKEFRDYNSSFSSSSSTFHEWMGIPLDFMFEGNRETIVWVVQNEGCLTDSESDRQELVVHSRYNVYSCNRFTLKSLDDSLLVIVDHSKELFA